jgi:hypothetical protein
MSLYRKFALSFALSLLTSGSLMAQISADQAIGFIDQLPASKLDPVLPKTPFLSWLNELVGPAAGKIHWEMNDCSELTGVPAVDDERDISVCIEATIQLSETQKIGIAVRIGTEKKGLSDFPTVANIFWESGEEIAYFKQLSELQKALIPSKPKQ